MKILVTYGSKYGSTRGIAERVAERLRAGGHDVTTTDVRQAGDLSDYGGVVLGSGIYAGGLHRDMTKLLTQQHDVLAGKKAAAFAVCLAAAQNTPEQKAEAEKYAQLFAAQVNCTHAASFAGAHDPQAMWFLARWILKAMKAEPGDFRDWPVIEAWADEIASAWA